jgi:hypothetical protein
MVHDCQCNARLHGCQWWSMAGWDIRLPCTLFTQFISFVRSRIPVETSSDGLERQDEMGQNKTLSNPNRALLCERSSLSLSPSKFPPSVCQALSAGLLTRNRCERLRPNTQQRERPAACVRLQAHLLGDAGATSEIFTRVSVFWDGDNSRTKARRQETTSTSSNANGKTRKASFSHQASCLVHLFHSALVQITKLEPGRTRKGNCLLPP